MSFKSKGINAERDLIHRFWSKNLPAVRIAGSGSSKYPSPDILAGNRLRRFAIEVKITKEKRKYLTKEEVDDLEKFSKLFGAEPWLAIKFKGVDWLFLPVREVIETEKSFLVDEDTAKRKGILFEELTKDF
jgi:Holliday junction resolvase